MFVCVICQAQEPSRVTRVFFKMECSDSNDSDDVGSTDSGGCLGVAIATLSDSDCTEFADMEATSAAFDAGWAAADDPEALFNPSAAGGVDSGCLETELEAVLDQMIASGELTLNFSPEEAVLDDVGDSAAGTGSAWQLPSSSSSESELEAAFSVSSSSVVIADDDHDDGGSSVSDVDMGVSDSLPGAVESEAEAGVAESPEAKLQHTWELLSSDESGAEAGVPEAKLPEHTSSDESCADESCAEAVVEGRESKPLEHKWELPSSDDEDAGGRPAHDSPKQADSLPGAVESEAEAGVAESPGAKLQHTWELPSSDESGAEAGVPKAKLPPQKPPRRRVRSDQQEEKREEKRQLRRQPSDVSFAVSSDHEGNIAAIIRGVTIPDFQSGVGWWAEFLREAFAGPLAELCLVRPPRLELLCAGTGGELLGLLTLGVPVSVLACAEKNPTSRRWLSQQFQHRIPHLFDNNSSLLTPAGGHCGKCSCVHGPAAERTDIMSGGFPCPPFSAQRDKSKDGPRTGPVQDHPMYDTTMVQFAQYVKQRQPYQFWMEQVPGFLRKLAALGGRSPLSLFVKALGELGYSVQCLHIDHCLFVDVARPRLWLWGVSQEAGGAKAADWILKLVTRVVTRRAQAPPTQIFDVVDPNDAEERQRLLACQACFFVFTLVVMVLHLI